jgi:hypothetical protein
MADHRLRVAPSRVEAVAGAIASALGVGSYNPGDKEKAALFPAQKTQLLNLIVG